MVGERVAEQGVDPLLAGGRLRGAGVGDHHGHGVRNLGRTWWGRIEAVEDRRDSLRVDQGGMIQR